MNGCTLGWGSNLHHLREHHGSVSQSMCINHWATLQDCICVCVQWAAWTALYSLLRSLAQDLREISVHDAEPWLPLPTSPITVLYIQSRLTEAVDVSVCVGVKCMFYALSMPFVYVYKNMHMLAYVENYCGWEHASLPLPLCCCSGITHNYTFILLVAELHVESISQVPELKILFIFSLEELF